MTKEFFFVVRDKLSRSIISELQLDNGALAFRNLETEKACLDFYLDLYKRQERGEEVLATKEEILEAVPTSVTPLMAFSLKQPISDSELHQSLMIIGQEKALGLYGKAVNFFVEFWDLIGVDYEYMVRKAI